MVGGIDQTRRYETFDFPSSRSIQISILVFNMSAAPVVDSSVFIGKLYTRTRRHRIRYPKNFDPNSTVKTVPDPHRWLPKSQRPGQSRKRAGHIRGPQGQANSDMTSGSKPTGPSTAHIVTTAPTVSKKKSKGNRK